MSLMSLQLFVLCAEFAHMHTHSHTHADEDTHQARAENWRANRDEERGAIFSDGKGRKSQFLMLSLFNELLPPL